MSYQISLFDIINNRKQFKIDKPIRLIELFAGYGSQHFALDYLEVNFESWKICEWAIKSIQAYKDAHFSTDNTDYSKELTRDQVEEYLFNKGISSNYNDPMTLEQIKRLGEEKLRTIYNNIMATHNLVNICQVHSKDLNIVDTDKYDYVLTYSFPCGLAGTKVITKNGYKNIEDVSTDDYVQTHNNRYCRVVKTMSRVSNHYYVLKGLGVPELYLTEEHPLYVFRDGKFQWVKVKDLKLTDMFSFNINQNEKDANLSEEYLWLLGRYVADGWVNKRLYNSVEFAISYSKEKEFLKNIPSEFVPKFKKIKKKCWEYRIADKTFQDFCKEFGNGALNKCIPSWIIDLPKNKLQAFFNGYISGDGHIRERSGVKQIMFSTVSETLFLGMQQIAAKLFGSLFTCSIRKDKRKSTFNDTYNCQINIIPYHRDQFVNDDKICTKIRKIERFDESVPVYNFEVEDDNSYTCQNVIVHNCQDLSKAGKLAGMGKGSGTRSGLLWEVERILEECNGNLPHVLIMENVPDVIGEKNKLEFAKWYQKLESLGYANFYKILNAKDYGIPQNRERCFMVSVLGDYYYVFPEQRKLKKRLKDFLEPHVDEKYFLSDKMIQGMINTKFESYKMENKLIDQNGIANTIIARFEGTPQCIAVKEKTKKGYAEAYDGDGVYINRPEQKRGVVQKVMIQTLKTSLDVGVVVNDSINVIGNYSPSGHHASRIVDSEGIAPTVTENHGTVTATVVNDEIKPKLVGGIGDKKSNGGTQYYQQDRIYDSESIAMAHPANLPGGSYKYQVNILPLRIRKLSPLECWRLMGVKDQDFEKIAKNQSDSSLYHLAGDSIVVDVLKEIISMMLD